MNQFQLVYLAHVAETFQHRAAVGHGRQLGGQSFADFMDAFRHERFELSRSFLEHDPLNIGLIDLVDGVAYAAKMEVFIGKNGNITYRPVEGSETPEERRARNQAASDQRHYFTLQRLTASPYHAEYWRDYASSARLRNPPASSFDGIAALQNALIFSNDPLRAVEGLMTAHAANFSLIKQVEKTPKEDLERLPHWQAFYRDTNVPRQILCPYLRARLLKDAICAATQTETPSCRESLFGPVEPDKELMERAKASPECKGVLNASVEDLLYELTDFETATNQARE